MQEFDAKILGMKMIEGHSITHEEQKNTHKSLYNSFVIVLVIWDKMRWVYGNLKQKMLKNLGVLSLDWWYLNGIGIEDIRIDLISQFHGVEISWNCRLWNWNGVGIGVSRIATSLISR